PSPSPYSPNSFHFVPTQNTLSTEIGFDNLVSAQNAHWGTIRMSDEKPIERMTVPVWPDAGQMLGLGRNATYDAVARGEIPVLRFGRRILVPRKALERLVNGDAACRIMETKNPAPGATDNGAGFGVRDAADPRANPDEPHA